MESLIFDRKHGLFIRRTFFTISSLRSWCEPRVTPHYRLLLLSGAVPSPGEPRTFLIAPRPPLSAPPRSRIKTPARVQKDKAFRCSLIAHQLVANRGFFFTLCACTPQFLPKPLHHHHRFIAVTSSRTDMLAVDGCGADIGNRCNVSVCLKMSLFDCFLIKVMDLFKSGPKQGNVDRRTTVRDLGQRLH